MNSILCACIVACLLAGNALSTERPAKGSITFGSSKTLSTQAPNAKAASIAFVEVAKFVKSSVVSVTSQKMLKRQAYPNMYGNPFDFFFGTPFDQQNPGRRPQQQAPEQEFKQQGLGSGVIVSKDGYILTNNHVVEGADEITISLPGNKDIEADIIGTDTLADVAVLKLKESVKDLPVAALGNSDSVEVGEWVLAIGNPFSKQLSQTVTAGIVSAKGRNAGINRYENFIQTDASINPGNSGGALVNLKGEVIGINTAIMSRSGGNVGIGFAIPINMARKVMEDLIYVGKVSRGWLGVVMQPIDNTMAEALGLKDNSGILVQKVLAGSPADKAGIKNGDALIAVDGTKIQDKDHLKDLIGNTAPNTKIDVTVVREKKEKHLKEVLAELPSGAEQGAVSDEAGAEDLIGLAVRDMTPDLAQQYGLEGDDKGALITGISMKSSAGNTDLRVGDLIQKINNADIKNASDYHSAVKKASVGQSLLMYVKRGKDNFFVGIKIREKKKD